MDRVFVYGTLMRGFDHAMSKRLSAGANYLGDATCRGRLYMIAHYPGLLLSDDDGDVVHGEVFRLRDAALMAALDDYEGCGPHDAKPTAYLRQVIPVTMADGTALDAWTYVYNWPVIETKRIASGRFLDV
ncbi:MAG: gamma-glutamylcyclotransferase family protein [Tardiphaga sp.]